MVQTRNPRTLVAAEVVAFGGGDDGEEMMMMALGGVGWQQWWYKWSGEAAAVMRRDGGCGRWVPGDGGGDVGTQNGEEGERDLGSVSGETEKLSGMSFHIELL
ncbi:hypothetical protein Tco_0252839 [Tanacetum coccineum]